MPGTFFRKTPARGMPLAFEGLAEGLARIERVLERLEVVDGEVVRDGDYWFIVNSTTSPLMQDLGDNLPEPTEAGQMLYSAGDTESGLNWVVLDPPDTSVENPVVGYDAATSALVWVEGLPPEPSGPALFAYDVANGVRWLGIDAAYKTAWRSAAGNMVSDYPRRN